MGTCPHDRGPVEKHILRRPDDALIGMTLLSAWDTAETEHGLSVHAPRGECGHWHGELRPPSWCSCCKWQDPTRVLCVHVHSIMPTETDDMLLCKTVEPLKWDYTGPLPSAVVPALADLW